MTEVGVFIPLDFHNRNLDERSDGTRVIAFRDESDGQLRVDTGYSSATYSLDEVVRLGDGAEYAYDAGVEAILRATHKASMKSLLPGTVKQLSRLT